MRARVIAGVGAMTLALVAGTAMDATAQAICSAPHSSPTLTQSGAIRTLPAGTGWAQLSLYGQRSSENFDPLGDRRPFLANSTFDVRSVFVTGAVGIVEGLEVWAQVPVHHLEVSGDGGSSDSFGLGDIRGAVRLSPAMLGYEVPLALRAGVKIPGAEFPVDATQIPLSEGQADYELSLESGWSSPDVRLYVVGWVGYRWRTVNEDVGYDPGDETFAHAAVGGFEGTFNWELGLDGLWGGAPVESGLTLPSGARRLLQLLPTVGVAVGPGRVELTAPIPLAGRNLPAGMGLSLGYRTTWGL